MGLLLGFGMAETDVLPSLLDVVIGDDLAKMLRQFPLPAGVSDADMNQSEIAQALDTTVNTVAKWVKEGMPVAREGGNGMPYVLRLSHCWAWRKSREAEADSRNRHNENQISLLRAEFLGVDIGSQAAQLTPKERRELAEADMRWSEAQRRRRQLVQIGDVLDLLEGIGKIVRDGVEAMPDRLERELDLSPVQVASVARIGSDILTAISDRIEESELQDNEIAEADFGSDLLI